MSKLRRNEPCHCGSGEKYKHCHGAYSSSPHGRRTKVDLSNIFTQLRRHESREEMRRIQQGLGRPIISIVQHQHRMVAVGNTSHWSKNWEAFPDFLSDYIKTTLGPDWGNSEIHKPFEARHPILQWYDVSARYQKAMHDKNGNTAGTPITGATACYLGLAYCLYLIAHNVELQARLVKRLKDPVQFQGAYYELVVASILIRAGFMLELEDETDGLTKHCEYSARSNRTGKKYWIEAKMRSVSGVLGKTFVDGTSRANPLSHLSYHLTEALKKPAHDERLIFVDLNAPASVEDREKHLLASRAKSG